MKKYLLDTCIVVFLFRDKYNVAERMDAAGLENCYISEVTVAELQAGVEKSSQGTPVADFDLLIGCSALENDLIMVTENVKHFRPIPGIQLENWIER